MINKKILLAVMIFVAVMISVAYAKTCDVSTGSRGATACLSPNWAGNCLGSGDPVSPCKLSCGSLVYCLDMERPKWWHGCDWCGWGQSCGGWTVTCETTESTCDDYCTINLGLSGGTKGASPANTCTQPSIRGCNCYYKIAKDGVKCFKGRADCCNSGFCTNDYCCSEKDCTKSSRVKMDPAGGGGCDADNDGVYCGTPSCGIGKTTTRFGGTDVSPGDCNCINDDPTKYFDTGEATTNFPAAFKLPLLHPVLWYDLEIKGENLNAYLSSVAFAYKNGALGVGEWSLFNDVRESGTAITTIYPYKNLVSTSLAFKIRLNTLYNSETPKVTNINARSFPRLYNSDNNIVQHAAQTMCWPVREKVTCDINGKVGSIAPCKDDGSGKNATSSVRGDLNTGAYKEINPFDNWKNFTDTNWCVTPTNKDFRQTTSAQGNCETNSECELLCCNQSGKCDAATAIHRDGNLINVPSKNPISYCGKYIGDLCTNSKDCSTFCCDESTSSCVYLDKENPEQTKGCIPG